MKKTHCCRIFIFFAFSLISFQSFSMTGGDSLIDVTDVSCRVTSVKRVVWNVELQEQSLSDAEHELEQVFCSPIKGLSFVDASLKRAINKENVEYLTQKKQKILGTPYQWVIAKYFEDDSWDEKNLVKNFILKELVSDIL